MRSMGSMLAMALALALAFVLTGPALAQSEPAVRSAAATKAAENIQAFGSVKASKELCDLLDDPAARGKMDGLLRRLLLACGRESELGRVSQEPATQVAGNGNGPVTPDVPVNDPSGDDGTASHTQSESSIAYNPTTGTICSGFNDSFHGVVNSDGFTGFSRSTDDGATFQDQGALGANSGGDPSIVWRQLDGNFYFAALESLGLGIWRSSDDCLTFEYLGNTHVSGGDDKEILAVDNTVGSPNYGRLYVGWTDFNAGSRIYVNYSDDGSTWSPAVAVSDAGGDFQGAWPVTAPNGDLFVGWVRWNPFPNGNIDIEIVRSTDGGDTFTPVTDPMSDEVNPRDATASNSCFRPALDGNIRYLPSPQLVVGDDGALHVVYAYDQDGFDVGDEIDVFYRKSTDSGATWLPEIQLNDDATTNDQFFPTLSIGPSNVLVAAWYDRRLDAGNMMFDYYKSFSFDGGTTWQPNQRVSDVSSPVYLDPNLATCYHGDYDQQIQTGSFVYVQWSDDRNIQDGHNDPDIYFEAMAVSTDFLVTASPTSTEVCAPDDAEFDIDVLQFEGFSEPVTLSTSGLAAGLSDSFTTNPVAPPGSSMLTISGTDGVAAGSYSFDVVGTSSPSAIVHDASVSIDIFNALPDTPTLTSPGDGATEVALLPTLTWTAAVQASDYTVEVATDVGFTNIVFTASTTNTTVDVTVALEPVATYYWRVRGANICGEGSDSATFSFTTADIPPILLVDDDDNGPDVRATYEATLTALGRQYDIWDTANSDNEPSDAQLAPYDVVIWFTGDEFGGFAGPGDSGETALGTWLDSGGKCLYISSQDYHFDNPLTPFMQTYLGIASVTNDTDQNTITGAGQAFAGLGPYALVYPFTDFSDTLTVDATAEIAFIGDVGDTAASKDGGNYRTIYSTTPFVALPDAASREEVMSRVFEFCNVDEIFDDGFESGDTTSWNTTVGSN